MTSSRSSFRWFAAAALVIGVTAAGSSAQTLLVDTGAGSAGGGYSLFNDGSSFQHLGCQFTINNDFEIGTIEAWMVRPSGSVDIKLRANTAGNLPGAELDSTSELFTFAGFNAQWVSISGLNWSQPAGTYWITFEPQSGANLGSMPGNAPNPLPRSAYLADGNPGWVAYSPGDATGRFGLRLFTPAPEEPILVPGDYATIQLAINAASNSDEIHVAAGTYAEAINFQGKTIVLRRAPGRGEAIIDATGLNAPAVTISPGSGGGTELDGFTIRGGSAVAGLGNGGGVLVNDSTALISNCNIIENQAESGGGVAAMFDADATFINCTIADNSAQTLGGGGYVNDATLHLEDCIVSINSAGGSGGGLNVNVNGTAIVTGTSFAGNDAANAGGAVVVISATAVGTFTDCEFSENTAVQAGGAFVNNGQATFTGCDFLDNVASFVGLTSGGGIQAQGTSGSITVDACFLSANQAENGGGIQLLNYTGTAVITSSMFDDNSANIFGGAVHVRQSNATISDCIITANQAALGGGIYVSTGSSLSLGGTSFCSNAPDAIDGSYANAGGNILTCPDPGDTNGDGVVNVADLLNVISAWGACPLPPAACPADVNGDGTINVADLLMVISNWG